MTRHKKKGKLRMSPELVVQANREMAFLLERECRNPLPEEESGPKHFMRMIARRTEDLKGRGYPEEWIEKDIKKLMDGL